MQRKVQPELPVAENLTATVPTASSLYRFRQEVEYFSSREGWLPARVLVVDDKRGIQVSIRHGYWLHGRDLLEKVRPVLEQPKAIARTPRTGGYAEEKAKPADGARLAKLQALLEPKPRKRGGRKPQAMHLNDNDSIAYSELRFDTKIGHGTFGSVWKGFCLGNGNSPVAIKQLHEADDPKAAEFLRLEIAYLSSLRHPRLVSFFGCCQNKSRIILVMEFMPRGSLYRLLFEENYWPRLQQKWGMCLQISEGLVYLHAENVVHRDLKTMNIVLDDELNCKICDFGLMVSLERTHVTVQALQGTPRYLAPEQFVEGAKITEKVDMWQMGCLMLELFCLKVPFAAAQSVQEISTELLVRKKPPAVPEDTGVSPSARTIMESCLQIQAKRRPNADGLEEALRQLAVFG